MSSPSTEVLDKGKEILDTMLGYLGFVIEVQSDPETPYAGLQIYSEEAKVLIGKDGKGLDDLQYLVNRLLHEQFPKAKRVRVDIEHYRTMQEDAMVRKVQGEADNVRRSGRSVKLWPMNSYHRRLVHDAFKDDAAIQTWSPPDSAKLKRITLMRRK